MVGIIITGHGHYASGLASAVTLLNGPAEAFAAVDFVQGDGVEDLRAKLGAAIEALPGEAVLLLVDLVGGTPFNVAAQFLVDGIGRPLKIVAGCNLTIATQLVFEREDSPLEALVAAAVEEGKNGIVSL